MIEFFKLNGSITRNFKYGLYAFYFVLFVIAWHIAPGNVVKSFPEIAHSFNILWFEKGFAQDIIQSMQLNLIAMFVTLILTLILGYISTFPFAQPLAFALTKGRFLGLMGLNALFIEVFGLGMGLKVSLLTFGIGVFYLTSMYTIVTEIPQEKFDYAKSLRLSKLQIMWHVIIRGTLDQMLESLRQNAAIGWMMITAVEGIVKSGGIGDILYNSYKHFDRGEVLAIIATILLIGILQDIGLKKLQKILTPHTI